MMLEIIKLGDPLLHQKSVEVTDFKEVADFVDAMIDTMYAANGIGLAAVQVSILKRIFVIDIPELMEKPITFINPEIIESSKDLFLYEEGCLSIPEIRGMIKRPRSVKVKYQDEKGEAKELLAEEVLAICIQHEMDHLNGILFPERIDPKDTKEIKKVGEDLKKHHFPELNLASNPYS